MSGSLVLRGCTPEPLGNYLKALGVFRLVAEQADPNAMGFWKDGLFWLITNLSKDNLADFFVKGIGESCHPVYNPTPIFAPWGGRPGFYKDGNREAKSRLAKILWCTRRLKRFRNAAETIRALRSQLRQQGWIQTKPKKDKLGVVTSARRLWPTVAIDWFDACLAIEDDPRFGFLYGTGGNEGSADITNNFWELIEEVIGIPEPKPHTEEMLKCALFGTARAAGTSRSAGQHFPSATDSPNIGQDFTGSTSANPWDVVLMMEGGILFAGAATKRLSQYGKGKAAFPFMLDYVATGEPQSSQKDESKQNARIMRSRAEFWMPLWHRPTTLSEFKALLREGRLQRITDDSATHSLQAMEAISSLGVSRGVVAFQRVGLFERRGKGYYVASSLGNYPVPQQPHPLGPLLAELSPVRDQAYRNLREGPGIPDRILTARRRMNTALAATLSDNHDVHRNYGGDALTVLESISVLEQEVSLLKERGFRFMPCPPLSNAWRDMGENSCEYRIARAIASITSWGVREKKGRSAQAVEAIRANLLPVTRRDNTWQWDEISRSAVWAPGASLFDNLAAVLRRRLIASKGSDDGLPLWSAYGASYSDLVALWNSEVDEERLNDLIHALALIDTGRSDSIGRSQESNDPTPELHSSGIWFDADDRPRVNNNPVAWRGRQLMTKEELNSAFALPRMYALLKLCFVGGHLPAAPVEERTVGRTGEEPYPPHAPEILNLLSAGRLSDAVTVAARKLRAKGYPSIFDPRYMNPSDICMTIEDCRRLAGMLLIPVRHAGVLAALAIKPRTLNP